MVCAGTSVSTSAFPRFRFRERELRPLLLVAFRESLRELLEVRFAPLHCTGPVQPGRCSSRASPSRLDLCSTRSFLVHVIHNLALPHDVLQH